MYIKERIMEMLHFSRRYITAIIIPFFLINMLSHFYFNSNSTLMENCSSRQDQKSPCHNYPNPNPSPNLEHDREQLDGAFYFKNVLDYLMSDESLDETRDLSRNSNVFVQDQSSSSACSINPRRIVKKYKKEKQEFRVAFRTKSDLEIMDDGFKWRKYGKKMVKSSPNPRNYFKCSNGGCSVKKRVERDGNDSNYVITSYEGVHNHQSPTHVLYCNPQSFSL